MTFDEHDDEHYKEWVRKQFKLTECLNREIPVDELRLDLTDEEKADYERSLAWLKKEREQCPEVKYEIKYSWFD